MVGEFTRSGATLMSAGRRGVFLALGFLAAALALCPPATAQQPGVLQFPEPPRNVGRHSIWDQPQLTPDQIRDLLKLPRPENGLEEQLRQQLRAQNPNIDPKLFDDEIKRALGNKQLMDWLTDEAQREANKQANNPAGQPPKVSPELLERLKRQMGEQFKVERPPVDPKAFDPKGFDPKGFDPNRPGGKPGQMLPAAPPPLPPPPPPDGPQGFEPKRDPFQPIEQNNPLFDPKEMAERQAKMKAVETATALWEKNVGPIDESPAVKRAILDLVNDPELMESLTDDNGRNLFDFLRDEAGRGEGLDDLFGGQKWEWPKLDFDWGGRGLDWDLGGRRRGPDFDWNMPRAPRGGGGFSGFSFGGIAIPTTLIIIILLLIAAAVVWWKWDVIVAARAGTATAVEGLGPWPVDPRAINSREDVVKAFEYLSVLICGPAAKTWTHSTIADELSALARTHGETAVKLARLYELARYAPLDEPLTRTELVEARRLVCDLAGIDEV